MFKRSFAAKDRAGKAQKLSKAPKRSFRDDVKKRMLEERLDSPSSVGSYVSSIAQDCHDRTNPDDSGSPQLTSSIITLVVGPDQRLFAAHEDVLCHSPLFQEALKGQFFESPNSRRITLPDTEPEEFSCVLEYLYKGDYYPRLVHDKRRNTWNLEDSGSVSRSSNGSRFESRACRAESRSAPSSAAHDLRTQTRRTRTRDCAPTTSHSLSAAARPSSGAAPCRWRWRSAANCSSTCSSPCATTWMT